ncbi:MAG: OmpH family outer membrane protein [Nitrospirae bacterium]|nr:MAG: OmpH family outer membrane protein [Nitrospirota bacterium]
MKRFVSLVCLMAFALTIITGLVSSVSAADIKIGVVDVRKALFESEAGKRASADLDVLVKAKQTAIDEKAKAIDKMKADLERQASAISVDARKAKEAEMERLVRDYQRIAADSQADLKKKEAELSDDILKEIFDVINKLAQEEKYSLIVEKLAGIVYSDKALDITEKVIARYNESKKAAPAK